MYAVLKIEDAAKELGMGTTALKKRCRQYGIHRWPHRQLKSLDNLIDALEKLTDDSTGDSTDASCIETAIMQLKYHRQRIAKDPCYKIPQSVFRLRQAQFKDKHRRTKEVNCV